MLSGVLINKELESNVPSLRRNPILADIFARMKFMPRGGSGFDKIVNGTNRLFDDNENHVEFYATEIHFSVVLYNANYGKLESGTINDNEKLVLMLMKENSKITITEIVEKIKISTRTVNRIITSLKEKALIEREGSNKGGYWKVNE